MSEGPGVGAILVGIFLVLFGLSITLAGGGCTVMLLSDFQNIIRYGGWFFLLISLAILALGLFLTWVGIKVLTGRK